MNKREQGFTLIEIAIVLVIIGLLLGGVLKGQELITGARVRNLIGQQDGIKAAYFGFLDRYRALPGDYKNAQATIQNTTKDGDGDGQIETGAANNEATLAWEHLARAGFINGSYTYNAAVSEATSPMNPFGSFIELVHDDKYGGAAAAVRPNLKTGNRVPVEILAEIDRKVDDGLPNTGSFRVSDYGAPAPDAGCITAAAPIVWDGKAGAANCSAATLF
jgi:prepilin-type N-terminal cleavage/methylation domain-containing protein